jgi:hypothetical protein
MSPKFLAPCLAVVILFSLATVSQAQRNLPPAFFPRPVDHNLFDTAPYRSVDFLSMEWDEKVYRGSASVVRNPSLLYTCGHNLLEEV